MTDATPIDLGSRLEPMVDDFLIERMTGARLRLHHPQPREVGLVLDRPWEGSGSGYVTVMHEGDLYRMWYKGNSLDVRDGRLLPVTDSVCYAESDDGVTWRRPSLGIVEHEGSRDTNIIWRGQGDHGFCPFRDGNPACPPDQRYKAVGQGRFEDAAALWALTSPDGIHWELLGDRPILRGTPFDSQNLVFWDGVRGEYRAYIRDFRGGEPGVGLRDIRTATSSDFLSWSEPQWLRYPGAPDEQLYTNQVQPYYRAPHIFVGLPARYVERGWSPSMEALPDQENRRKVAEAHVRFGTAISDTLLMTSRDGITFRRWDEAFLPPGPQRPGTWIYGHQYVSLGLVEVASLLPGAPDELCFWAGENVWLAPVALRRYALRIDGFASAHAPLSGGEMLTRPLSYAGGRLILNFATSAAGAIRVEIQHADGRPIEGFALSDCDEVFGDEIERPVTWRGGESDVSSLAGRPIRLRFVMSDADLFSLRFI